MDEGAMALFGEKYGDEVRVISRGTRTNNKKFSKELCGGTHVNKTGEIIDFKIINQSRVASGIRRIEALSKVTVNHYKQEQIKLINQKKEENQIKIKELIKEIKKFDENFSYNLDNNAELSITIKELRKELELKKQNQNKEQISQNMVNEKIKEIEFIYLIAEEYPPKLLKQFVEDQKNKYKQKGVSLIISKKENKLSMVLGATNDLINNFESSKIIQEVSKILGGKGGGGRKELAQAGGLSLENINKAITKIKKSPEF
jgi:Alanyl-tRNA synthetase